MTGSNAAVAVAAVGACGCRWLRFLAVMTSQGASDNVDNASEEAPLWNYVTKLEKSGAKGGTWKFKCNICNEDRQGSYSRIRAHLLGIKNQGIAICKKATRSQKSDMQKLEDEFEKKKNESVIFEASSVEVRQTLLEPNGFCRLLPLSQRILTLLHHFEEWSIFHVSGPKNRVATAIAESVVSGARTQSYVASGGPRWLDQMIQQERGV
ncbi:hypothetical protein YC2023_024848 [Brassica napus]